MKPLKMLRNGMIGTLIALVPMTSGIAATRPSAAVPMAGSTASASAATAGIGDDESIGWVGLAAGVVAIALFALLVLDNGDDDDDALSPA